MPTQAEQRQKAKEEKAAQAERDREARKHAWANSDDWKMVKAQLIRKLMNMDSSSMTFEELKRKRKSVATIKEELYSNAKAVKVVVDWMDEIENYSGGTRTEVNEMKEAEIIVEIE